MISTSIYIHCSDHEPHEFAISVIPFVAVCELTLDVRSAPNTYQNGVSIFLPRSMLPRLTRAVDAFNTAMTQQTAPAITPQKDVAS